LKSRRKRPLLKGDNGHSVDLVTDLKSCDKKLRVLEDDVQRMSRTRLGFVQNFPSLQQLNGRERFGEAPLYLAA
jgi:hypothetical protein